MESVSYYYAGSEAIEAGGLVVVPTVSGWPVKGFGLWNDAQANLQYVGKSLNRLIKQAFPADAAMHDALIPPPKRSWMLIKINEAYVMWGTRLP